MKNVIIAASLLTSVACGKLTVLPNTNQAVSASPAPSQGPSQASVTTVTTPEEQLPVQDAPAGNSNVVVDGNTANPNAEDPNASPINADGTFNYNVIKLVQIGMNPNAIDAAGNVDGCNITTGPMGQYMYWRSGATGFTTVQNGVAIWSQTSGVWTTVYTFYPDGSAQQLWRRSAKDPAGPCVSVINSARAYIVVPTGYETYSNYNH